MATPEAEPGLERLRVLDPILRWRYPILVLLTVAATAHAVETPFRDDWRYFVWGSQLLFGSHPDWAVEPGGVHLYANYGEIQIGPLTLLVVTLLRIFGSGGSRIAAIVTMAAMGPALVWQLERTARRVGGMNRTSERARQFTVLFGGAAVLVAWAELAGFWIHLDDALALGFGVLAASAVTARCPVAAGVLIGAAIASKPWAVVFIPLAAALPGRGGWRALTTACGVAAIGWLPFLVGDWRTLTAGQPFLPVDRNSVLHLFGVPVGDAPQWLRPAQLGLGMLAGAIAVQRRRWHAVLLAGVAVRVLLDPGVFDYYGSGLLLAAFTWEILRASRPLPPLTMVLFWTLFTLTEAGVPTAVQATARLAGCIAAICLPLACRVNAEEETPPVEAPAARRPSADAPSSTASCKERPSH